MKNWILPTAIAAALVSGCSGMSDNVLPPTELKSIEPSLGVSTLWDVNAGAGNSGQYTILSPWAGDGKVFAVDAKGTVSALDAAGGKAQWKTALDTRVTSGASGGAASVLVGTADGQVIALSAAAGSVKWKADLGSQVAAVSDIAEGMLVARCVNGHVAGLDALTGQVRWRWTREVPSLSLRTQSKPLLAHGGAAIGLDDGSVVMLALRTGQPVWEVSVAQGRGRTELDRLVDIDGQLVLSGEELFAVTYQGKVAAIDARRGALLWSRDASSSTGVEVDKKAIYLTDDKGVVRALSRTAGIELWKQDGLKYRRVTRPTLDGPAVVVGDYDGYLHWLDASSGRFIQRKRVSSSGILAPALKYRQSLLVQSDNGEVTALQQKGSD